MALGIILIINVALSCTKMTYNISDTWWFSIETLKYDCGSDGLGLGYIEMFTWEKNKQKHCTIIFDYDDLEIAKDFIISKTSINNQYLLKYLEGEEYGTLKIFSNEEAILYLNDAEINLYSNIQIGDPWDYNGNRDQFYEDRLCRKVKNIHKLIKQGIRRSHQ